MSDEPDFLPDDEGLADLFSEALHHPELPTETIGDYRIVRRLASKGAMSVVFEAIQLRTNRRVALKVLDVSIKAAPHSEDYAELEGRFHREIELASRLKHPNIATVYDGDPGGEIPYFAMEFVDGLPLDEFVTENRLGIGDIIRLMIPICQAIGEAHHQGVIHRDLKPANILVEDGVPKVLEFGLAKAIAGIDRANPLTDLSLRSRDDVALGTPAFMSPEQARGENERLDNRTDIYSLGAILCLLLTGRLPHESPGPDWKLLGKISQEEAIPPETDYQGRRMPRDLRAILAKALAFVRERRYNSAEDLAKDLERFLNHEPVQAAWISPFYPIRKHARKHWPAYSALTLVLAIAIAAGTAWILQIRSFGKKMQRSAETEAGLRIQAENAQKIAETAQAEAEAESRRARQSASEVDFRLATRYLQESDNSRAYAHLARAVRQDPENRPARALGAMLLTQDVSLKEICAPIAIPGISRSEAFSKTGGWFVIGGRGRAEIRRTSDGSLLEEIPVKGGDMLIRTVTLGGVECVAIGHRVTDAESYIDVFEPNEGKRHSFTVPGVLGTLQTDSGGGSIGAVLNLGGNKRAVYVWEAGMDNVATKVNGTQFESQLEAATFDFARERIIHSIPGRQSMAHFVAFGATESRPFEHMRLGTERTGVMLTNMAISPQGIIGLAGVGARVSIWHDETVDTGIHHRYTEGGSGHPMRSVTFSPDGREIMAGTRGGILRIWPVDGQGEARNIVTGKSILQIAIPMSNSSPLVATLHDDGAIQLWDRTKGEKLAGPNFDKGQGALSRIYLSPDGSRLLAVMKRTLAGGGFENLFRMWSTASVALKPAEIDCDPGVLLLMQTSADERFAIAHTVGREGLKVLDLDTGVLARSVFHHNGHDRYFPVRPAYAPETDLVATLASHYQVVVQDLRDSEKSVTTAKIAVPVQSMAFSPDGKFLFVGDKDNGANIYEIQSLDGGTLIPWKRISNPNVSSGRTIDDYIRDRVIGIHFSQDGELVAFNSYPKGDVRGYRWHHHQEGDSPQFVIPNSDTVSTVSFSSSARYAATGGADLHVHLADTRTGRQLGQTMFHPKAVKRFLFTPDERRGISTCSDGGVRFWRIEPETGLRLDAPPFFDEHGGSVYNLAISADGFLAAAGGSSGYLQLFDIDRAEPFGHPLPHPNKIVGVRFLPRRGVLLTGCGDGKLRLWPIPTGVEQAPQWFPDLLEAAGGRRIDPLTDEMVTMKPEDLANWRSNAASGKFDLSGSEYGRAAKTFLGLPGM